MTLGQWLVVAIIVGSAVGVIIWIASERRKEKGTYKKPIDKNIDDNGSA